MFRMQSLWTRKCKEIRHNNALQPTKNTEFPNLEELKVEASLGK